MSAKITVLGSSSQGNGYLLEIGEDKLILECGVPAKDMLALLDWKPQGVFALTTHAHFDHSKYIKQYKKFGINVYSNSDVAEKFENIKVLHPIKRYKIGNFVVMALDTPHGVPTYSYIIEHPEMGTLAFITDTSNWKYTIKSVNHWLIEANYDEEILINAICDNEDVRSQSQQHLSISKTINVLKRNYSASTMGVYLLHLSNGLSNEKEFENRVRKEIGVECHAVNIGDVYELKSQEF